MRDGAEQHAAAVREEARGERFGESQCRISIRPFW